MPQTVEARLRAQRDAVDAADGSAHHRLSSACAALVAAAAGTGLQVRFPLTVTTVLAVALAPVWIPRLAAWRGARLVSLALVLAVLAGAWMSLTSETHSTSERLLQSSAVQVLTAVGLLGVLLWVRSLVSLEVLAGSYAFGMLVTGLQDSAGSPNAWKFELGLATTTLVLALTQASRRPWASVVALLLLGLVGGLNDTRSALGFAVVTAAVVVWQATAGAAKGRRGPAQRLRIAGLVAGFGYGLYTLATSLLVSGALGSGLQARTAAQVTSGGGSLLLGGRPELTASLALVQHEPAGFGLGAVPNRDDVLVAKDAMSRVGISADNGYVDEYMFGGHFELHSVLADAWASMGWAGAAAVIAAAAVLVSALLAQLAERSASPLSVFWTVYALWWIGFGPLYSNLPDVVFALAITVLPRLAPGVRDAAPAPLRSASAVPAT